MTIRAAVFREVGKPFSVEDVNLQGPRQGEVLVRMKAAGVCHSDWHLVTGATQHPLPVVPGHEGAGVVEELGVGVGGLQIGDHVSLNWAPSCGACFYCLHGRPSLCQTFVEPIWAGVMFDGTTRLSQGGAHLYHFSSLACFAEYVVVPAVCCVPMPKEVPFDVAALIGCAVTTGVGAVLNTAKVTLGSSVAVFGVGGVGLSIILGAKLAGASPIVAIDVSEEKLAMARQLGASHVFLSSAKAVDEIRSITGGRGVDYGFEAIGNPGVQELCLESVRPGGTAVLAGIARSDQTLAISPARLTRQEKTLMGCYYGTANPARDFPAYAELYQAGKLELDRLVSRKYRLDQIGQAYEDLVSGAVGRGVIEFE